MTKGNSKKTFFLFCKQPNNERSRGHGGPRALRGASRGIARAFGRVESGEEEAGLGRVGVQDWEERVGEEAQEQAGGG